jgi:exopolysaccharide biosynthesis polyprenyl glycosylphosphotransferase
VKLRRSLDTPGVGPFAGIESAQERHILSQEEFHRVIALERRRTERSRKPFLLILLDLGQQLDSETAQKNGSALLATLSASTRETDAAGWYQASRIVGAMITDIGSEDRGSIMSTMTARLSAVLRNHLSFEQLSVSFHIYPEDWDQQTPRRTSNPVLYPDLSKREETKRTLGALKRIMDIAGSAVALFLAVPLFVCISIAIKATSRGPVFFRQRRIGQHGKSFVFLKFRSMYVNNDSAVHQQYVQQLIAGKAERHQSNGNGEGVFKLTNDPRITRVGSFLRRTSLDELPQFINVLKGEMSLVGPRPPVPYEVEAYEIWHRRRLLEAKPGITGLWQISGRSRVTFDEMVRLDLRYARAWSPWMDIKIILQTPRAVLLGSGAH